MTSALLQLLAAACCGVAVFSFALLVFDLLRNVEVEKMEMTADYKRLPLFFRMFMPFVPNMMPLIQHSSMKDSVRKTQEKLGMAGYEQVLTGEQFIAIRILMLAFGMIIALLAFSAGEHISAVLILMISAIYPTAWLNRIIARRHLEILKALPNVLDLLTLSVEAGRDFLTALRDIIGRRKTDSIGTELQRALHEIQLGKSRQAALKEMANRVRQPDLTTVINSIIQADELGVSIGQLLRVQGDQLRSKRFSRAEKLASESPVKILMPIVVCIFPCVFVVLMGPIMVQALRSFGQ